ncbi:MAG TPA: ABC transporter permease [Longimicrobiaceae bacterium]|nr:ABC transporter permease [Longimicrobiaceae bacterium]
MDSLLHDLRYALRSFARTPGFALVAVASLALGIGANTAIFATIEAALLRPLPVPAPGGLALVSLDRGGDVTPNFSYESYRRIAADPALAGALTFSPQPLDLAGEGGTERLSAELVSDNYFRLLGVAPGRGRAFTAAGTGAPALEAVLGHDLWRTRFAADPAVVGKPVRLNGQVFTVVGVAPEGFRGLVRGADPALWVPVTAQPLLTPGSDYVNDPGISWLFVAGRLAPGVTHAQAAERLNAAMRARDAAGEVPADWRMLAEPGSHGFGYLLSGTERPLWLLLGAVGFVLLIACANVANLLLARTAARRRELAVRASLGAGRGRLARQLLTETVLLALAGGAVGVLMAFWTTNVLAGFRPPAGESVRLDTGPSLPVLAFCLGLALLTGTVLGAVAALRAGRGDLVPALKAQPGSDGGGRIGVRGVLVATQVALAVVLLVGAGLFLRSLRNLQAVDPGFGARNVLLASVDLESAGYDAERGRAFYDRLLEAVRGLPGVEGATLARTVTPQPGGSRYDGMEVEGYVPAEGEVVGFDVNVVGAGYFETLDVPLLRGRGFTAADREGAPRVMVVNETMARRYWPGADPLGRYVRLGTESTAPRLQVVGVARDGKYRGLREEPTTNAYFPLAQAFRPSMTLLVRARGEPAALAGAVRAEVRVLDPSLAVFDVRTLREHLGQAMSQERMAATLVTGFGSLALLLAAVGVFGVLAYWVAQRSREIGIRMALGASRRGVLRLVLGRGMAFVAAGLAAGIAAAFALTRLAGSLLYGVSPTDPATFAAVAAVLGGVALLAGWLPAARAARVDPMVALRQE